MHHRQHAIFKARPASGDVLVDEFLGSRFVALAMAAEEVLKGDDRDRRVGLAQHKTAIILPRLRDLGVIRRRLAEGALTGQHNESDGDDDSYDDDSAENQPVALC